MSKRIPSHRSRRSPGGTSRRRRALGQHFLTNIAAARDIVSRFAPTPGTRVLEIGPGHGALTRFLLETGAHVVAVERDPRLAGSLRDRFGDTHRLEVIHADILACDPEELAAGTRLRVLANLPYSITGPILRKLLLSSRWISDMTLMLQKEVADRLTARPGGRTYGSLSVLSQYFTEPVPLMHLKPGSFTPPPAVSSTVVSLPFLPRREISPEHEDDYAAFIHGLFGRRRRTLRNNLRALGFLDPPGEASRLEEAGYDLGRRPETLGREEVLDLYRLLRDGPHRV